jgi:hypothetical protein
VLLLEACSVFPTPGPTEPPPTSTAIPATPTPTPPAGFTIRQAQGFRIDLPDAWKAVTLDDATLKQEIDTASTDNPHLADALRGILSSGQNKSMLFYAANPSSTGEIVDSVTVVRTTLAAGTTAEQATGDFANNLPNVMKGAKLVMYEPRMQINGLDSGEVDYDMPLVNSAGRVVKVRGVQFVIGTGAGEAYIITLVGDAAHEGEFVPLARTIGRSFLVAGP